jgi:hypothetical protein
MLNILLTLLQLADWGVLLWRHSAAIDNVDGVPSRLRRGPPLSDAMPTMRRSGKDAAQTNTEEEGEDEDEGENDDDDEDDDEDDPKEREDEGINEDKEQKDNESL